MRSIDTFDRRIASAVVVACVSIRWLLLAAAPVLAAAGMAHAQSGSIAGAVRLTNCTVRPADVTVSAGAKTVSAERDPNSESVFRYRISGLAKGQHNVTPHLATGTCAGGAWRPASRNVRLSPPQAVTGQDFEYRVPRQSKRISGAILASLFEQVFRGSLVHLSNYGPRHDETWHKANDSFIRLGPGAGGGELRFDIPEIKGQSGRRYYVNDLNLSRLTVRAEAGAIKLLLELDGRGSEIKGRCVDDITCFGADDAAPDFNVTGARLELAFTPARDPSGGIGYGPVRATFFAAIDGRGVGELGEGSVERQIKPAVEAIARQALDQRGVQDRVAAALRPTLDAMQIASVDTALMDGQDLVVEYTSR
jgi:hypothetical protein